MPSQEPQRSLSIPPSNRSITTSGLLLSSEFFGVRVRLFVSSGEMMVTPPTVRSASVYMGWEVKTSFPMAVETFHRAPGGPTSIQVDICSQIFKIVFLFCFYFIKGSVSNSNSRNQSPRSVNGEAKLRPGVTSRSSNRNSANLSSSAFQEELIRLISPDNIEAASEPKLCKEQRNHSRENLNNNTLSVHKVKVKFSFLLNNNVFIQQSYMYS